MVRPSAFASFKFSNSSYLDSISNRAGHRRSALPHPRSRRQGADCRRDRRRSSTPFTAQTPERAGTGTERPLPRNQSGGLMGLKHVPRRGMARTE
jgi:hypothetical protein